MSIAKKVETLTVTLAAVTAIVISVLDLAGVLDNVPWMKNRIPVLTLLILGAFIAYLIAEKPLAEREQATTLQEAIRQAVAASSGVDVQVFKNRGEFWQHASECIRNCKSTIDDLTWGLIPASDVMAHETAAYQEYRRQIGLATTGKGEHREKNYREIMSFPNGSRLSLALSLMDDRHPNYNIRFYDYDHTGSPLLLQFYIFDKSEVLISSPVPRGGSSEGQLVSIKSTQLAEILSHYFETVWRDAIVLKRGPLIELDFLNDLARRYGVPGVDQLRHPLPQDNGETL